MKSIVQLLSTSIGKKFVVGLTGLFLSLFLLVHLYINLHLFYNDGGVKFMELADFMGTVLIVRILEIGLFGGILLHILYSLVVTWQNKKANHQKYAMDVASRTSTFTSRNMFWMGLIVLIFLVLHIYGIWFKHKFGLVHEPMVDTTIGVLSDPVYATIYIVGVLALAFHLKHGFQSAFQTFGWNVPKYKPVIDALGVFMWLIVPIGYISLPVFFAFLGGHQ